MICQACGHENLADARFCSQCAAPLHQEILCARCGAANVPESKFCNQCAFPLTQGPGDRGPEQATGDRGHRTAAASLPLPLGEAGQVAEGDAGRVRAGPTSFANGRYQVQRFLGEGGKKRVYLAHDTRLDRDVAFALLKTDGLDAEGITRIRREAQAMARLGDHPHVVTVYDIGEENGQPYLVSQYMAGGDLSRLLAEADHHRLDWDLALRVADQVCQALEHAHQQGIVHRDVKPGNVWLSGGPGDRGQGTDRGSGPGLLAPDPQRLSPATTAVVAKLGDFGLALSLDRSRLTQAGMMVGTVHYTAPEQALGGEVTPRSDLYSLGALLYEMVCGRPPFVGDESVAIIGQHLNTPPVAPTWHNPEVPPGLEALILRLLEKDPTKRPVSASEVRAALASVAAPTPTPPPFPPPAGSDLSGEGQGERASPSHPIYRRTFVGREEELRQLRAAFDGALSGRGALLMVVGEPGIGKTALCEQLATYAAVRGGKTLIGHCYEEGSLSLPYLPFVEALRSHVLGREPDALKHDLGTGAAEVARIISEIRDRVSVEPTPSGDPDDDRWRLFQAVAGFLQNVANVQPLLLVLEDLHWADRGTLDLLIHLARSLQGARLVLIGTYRDVEVDRAHPLSGALAELRRVGDLPRVLLRGLTPDEVHRMINTIAGQEVRWSMAEAVHRQTEGNPLFVQEVLRYLVEEGLIVRQGDRWEGRWRGDATATAPEMSIPEGLRDVIGKRLSKLSAECNRLLAIAAVVGRDFRLDILRQVAGLGEEEVISGLEEATRVGVLEEQSHVGVIRYRFAHAFFRQTLYEEMSAPRRLRVHQEVARALERLYSPGDRSGEDQEDQLTGPTARAVGRLDEHAAELAEHFAQSTDPADLAKAVRYGELAAQRAMAVFAYGEAARHLEAALEVQEVRNPDDRPRRCDLLLALCEALGPAGEGQRVVEQVAEEAFALADALHDPVRCARAAWLAIYEGLRRFAGGARGASPLQQLWSDRLDHVAQPGTPERIDADLQRSTTLLAQQGRWQEARALNDRAREAARQLGDTDRLAYSANLAWAAPKNLDAFMALVQELAEVAPEARAMRSTWALANFLSSHAVSCLMVGDRDAAEQAQREVERLAERSQDPLLLLSPLEHEGQRLMFDGELESALEAGERLVARGDELGSPVLGRLTAGGLTFRPLIWLGRPMDALAAALSSRQRGGWADRPNWFRVGERALCLAHAGQAGDARAQLADDLARTDISEDTPIRVLSSLLEAAILLEDREVAERLAPLLGKIIAHAPIKSVALLVGQAAALLGDPAAARAHYERSLDWATKIRFRPEIALARLAMAELALGETAPTPTPPPTLGEGRGERAEAAAHLDFALKEFETMKMQPSLERALALKELLKA